MTSAISDWWIKLDSDEAWDLDLLIEHFRSSDCTVTREEDGACYLKSARFHGLQNHTEVIEVARPLMAAMNGVARILAPWFHPVNSDKLTSVHDDGNRGTVLLAGPIVFRIPQEIPPRQPHLGNSNGLGKAELWSQTASNNVAVANALRIFGTRPLTWTNLYNVYELVREDVGGHTIDKLGWASARELGRFRMTANDPTIIGDEARHGGAKKIQWGTSSKPMPHDEAKDLVRRLLRCWIDSKI